MMILPFLLHPAQTFPAAVHATVACDLYPDCWTLHYHIQTPQPLCLPAPALPPQHRDLLWQRTCCEAFFAQPDGSYREYNFSPSGDWACYDFTHTRINQTPRPDLPAPAIACTPAPHGFSLTVRLPPQPRACRFALSLVLETAEHAIFHFALAHPAAQPDFHHPLAFRPLPNLG